MPRRISLAIMLVFALGGTAYGQARVKASSKAGTAKSLVRSQKGFKRDLAKLKKVKATTDLGALLKSKSRLTGKLSSESSPWNTMKEGKKQFDVSLGRGLTLSAGVGRYDLPMSIGGTQFKLHTLTIRNSNNKKSKSMVPEGQSISLKTGTSYSVHHHRINWRGPESRFSILALLHEQGHARDFGRANEAQKAKFTDVYDRIANNQKLSNAEHRQLVGLERSAWAYALKTARGLKRQGFDVLAGVTTKELSSVINSSLKGYYAYQGTAN